MFSLLIENELGNVIDLHDQINYVLTNVEGLTPPSATLFTAKSPNRKGVKHNGSTLNERTIALTIRLLGNIEANRNYLYNFVGTEQYAKIRLKNGLKNVYCEGYVEESVGNPFSEAETMNVVITCGDPYFKDLIEIAVQISQLLHQFTFSFAIDEKGIPFSTIKDNTETIINNTAVETGITISILFTGTTINPAIYNSKDKSKYIALNTTFNRGDIVIIETDGSPKTIRKYASNGEYENILKYANNNITWFTLKKGLNVFNYGADDGIENMQITISYSNKYLGI